jgi:hypothetical protein
LAAVTGPSLLPSAVAAHRLRSNAETAPLARPRDLADYRGPNPTSFTIRTLAVGSVLPGPRSRVTTSALGRKLVRELRWRIFIPMSRRIPFRWLLLASLPLSVSCGEGTAARRGARPPAAAAAWLPARGPFVHPTVTPTAEQPSVWLAAQREVIVKGQTPRVCLYSARHMGEYRKIEAFEFVGSTPAAIDRSCEPSAKAMPSNAFALLDFDCLRPASEGSYVVSIVPSKVGLQGPRVELALRVLADVPEPAPAPEGWELHPLAAGVPHACETSGALYEAGVDGAGVRLTRYRHERQPPLPAVLAARMSAEHARGVRYVFEDAEGWIVMSDLGEFGGGIEWFARGRAKPRRVPIENWGDDDMHQNVRRALASNQMLYVLQGLSHGTSSRGQLAVLWREHDHFSSRVIARYHSQPVDWLLQPDGSWLVLTQDAIWHTSRTGSLELVMHLPQVLPYLISLAVDGEGRLYAAGQNGVLRLTPRWAEAPRYGADLLLPEASDQAQCWAEWVRTGRPKPPPE